MRIVRGKFAGRTLMSPQGPQVRPTAENVRSKVLDVLADDMQRARVLDLFAGTGALGLEAISRGARSADFVEFKPDSLHSLRANVATLRLREKTRIFKRDAIPFVAALEAGKYDIAFADPPYGSRMLDMIIEQWYKTPFARILVAEHASTHVLPKGTSRYVFDDTTVTIYRLPEPEPEPEPTPEVSVDITAE